MYPSGQTAYLFVIPTERCVFERNERQDNRVFVVALTVDAVGGEQADRAIGLLRVGAPENMIIRDTEFDTGTDEGSNFVWEHKSAGASFAG